MNPEREKYEKIYSAVRTGNLKYGPYGEKMHGWDHREAVLAAESVLDVGCGQNGLMVWCTEQNPEGLYVGMDFACHDADVIHDITVRSGFEDDHFELVTAFDVLEHLRPEQIGPALSEMSRISRQFLFTIADYDCGFRVDGEPLHMTIRPYEWWLDEIARYARTVSNVGDVFQGEWLGPA